MSAALVYFPQGEPCMFDLEQELICFPKSEYSDQVDALAHAAIYVHKSWGLQFAGGNPVASDPAKQDGHAD
jgi:phage terminase large subunit-like protein